MFKEAKCAPPKAEPPKALPPVDPDCPAGGWPKKLLVGAAPPVVWLLFPCAGCPKKLMMARRRSRVQANNAGRNAHSDKGTRREVTCGFSIGLSESLGVALIQFAILNVNC